mgnify:CR=1 FL=1
MTEPRFLDRADAGRQLAAGLAEYRKTGPVVLGIPRGGVVVAAEVAWALDAELDVVVAKKLGAPGQQELAIGAVTADGGRYLNEELIESLGVSRSYLDAVTAVQAREAREREQRLRRDRPAVPLEGRVVIIVDDGLATGATALAAVRSVRARRPAKVIVAVPVGSDRSCERLRVEAEVVCLNELASLRAIGFYYREFFPVDETRVVALLAEADRPVATAAKR